MPKAASTKVSAKKTSKRGATPYNLFMKAELVRVKKDNPDMPHKEAFKAAASRWRNAPENPNREKKS